MYAVVRWTLLCLWFYGHTGPGLVMYGWWLAENVTLRRPCIGFEFYGSDGRENIYCTLYERAEEQAVAAVAATTVPEKSRPCRSRALGHAYQIPHSIASFSQNMNASCESVLFTFRRATRQKRGRAKRDYSPKCACRVCELTT